MEQKETMKKLNVTQDPIIGNKWTNLKDRLKTLSEKKPHLDFIAAVLTIPLLALTLYLNVANLKNKTAPVTPTPQPAVTIIEKNNTPQVVIPKVITAAQPTANTTSCIKEIGPIEISSPTEGQTVIANPTCIDINYQAGNYCSVVWSYSINSSTWS